MKTIKHCECITPHGETGMFCVQNSPWKHPVKALARCEDGIVRTIRLNIQADSFFSWAGSTKIKNKSTTGFVTFVTFEGNEENGEYRFMEYKQN